MQDADILFKMILTGDEGLIQNRIIEQLGLIVSEEAFMETIGTDNYILTRIVDEVKVKISLWVISLDSEFQQLRKSYYMNASILVLSIEEYDQDLHSKFEPIVDEVFSKTGKIPIAIVANTSEKKREVPELLELAAKLDASQLILDVENLDLLEEKMERLIRETLFNTEVGNAPCIL
ncbi:MAG: hypothetical protein E4H14_07300 [Candidatus Thorarchaeota archaeon]|nr:MAG: hypothetical protein E4H14_07300 [Candidatus Thorarchaeota archaeon]